MNIHAILLDTKEHVVIVAFDKMPYGDGFAAIAFYYEVTFGRFGWTWLNNLQKTGD